MNILDNETTLKIDKSDRKNFRPETKEHQELIQKIFSIFYRYLVILYFLRFEKKVIDGFVFFGEKLAEYVKTQMFLQIRFNFIFFLAIYLFVKFRNIEKKIS